MTDEAKRLFRLAQQNPKDYATRLKLADEIARGGDEWLAAAHGVSVFCDEWPDGAENCWRDETAACECIVKARQEFGSGALGIEGLYDGSVENAFVRLAVCMRAMSEAATASAPSP